MINPVVVARIVPAGIALAGLRRSPDSPTPAVMPVKAGKQIAKTMKKSLMLRISLAGISPGAMLPAAGRPRKKSSRVMKRMATTAYSIFIPVPDPLRSIIAPSITVTGRLITCLGTMTGRRSAAYLKKNSNASVKAIM